MKRKNNDETHITTQERFNNFVDNYNRDYIFFLQRAASGYYNCLITSGKILKDFHDFVIFVQRATEMKFEIVPYPFTFRHGQRYYQELGFDKVEIKKIHGFFDYVKETYEKDFEECMKEDRKFLCKA